MYAKSPCPSRDQLERLLLGKMTAEEMEALQGHVVGCLICLEVIRTVTTEDALVQAVRAGAKAKKISPEDTNPTLLARLRQLHLKAKSAFPSSLETLAPYPSKVEGIPGLLSGGGVPDELGRFGTYVILRSLGSGGMGVVFAARQAQPRRTVALKMLLGGWQGGKQRLARFRSETEIIAQLQHPNIVPVYEVGEHDGRPYYTMEYLDGGSLAQRLASALLAPRTGAELALVLARAVHFAHEHGVVHRDLKPANVLLAADGTPKIADFGLAKQLGSEPGEQASFQTESGAILGTPGYMAPEQVESKNEIGPAADVYALGAILYECLTGRPPFRAATVLETLEQVRTQEPAPIFRLQPSVPGDLQTICLTCLHKEPGRRYSSAAALADDLGRFLRGEPIQTRPVSTRERVWKWVRRNPLAALLVGVIVLSAVSAGVGITIHNARLRAEAARTAGQKQRALANYQAARETIQRMLNRLSQPALAAVPRAKELERQQFEDALAFYQQVVQQLDDPDPAVRFDVAQASQAAAGIEGQLGERQAAQENYRLAADLLESLVASAPERPDYRLGLVKCYVGMAHLNRMPGNDQVALAGDRKTLAFCEECSRLFPDDRQWRFRLATAQNNLGICHLQAGRLREAENCFTQALAIREALAVLEPNDAKLQSDTAGTTNNLGEIYRGEERLEEAEAAYRKAADIYERLLARAPDNYWLAMTAAMVAENRAAVLLAAGRPEAVVAIATPAIERMEPFVDKEPHLQANVALLNIRRRRAEAYQVLSDESRARRDWQRLADEASAFDAKKYRYVRARALAQLGRLTEAVAIVDAADPADASLDLVATFAVCARNVRTDASLSAAEQTVRSQQFAERAWKLLQQVRAAGLLDDPSEALNLRYGSDFDILRARADFQKFSAGLKAARKPEKR